MLVQKFPTECTTYIEPFVGAGGVFFEKEKKRFGKTRRRVVTVRL
jgi:site-specific DNA-adenine methylase